LEATFDSASGRDTAAQPLSIAVPRARPAFDSARIVYVSRTYEIRFFSKSQWVDTPARMLAPLLIEAIGASRRFQPVRSGAGVDAAFRLETEITALQQEFTVRPSQVRFGLRAQIVDVAEHRIVATRDFETVEEAPSDDPYGGVVAANRAVGRLLRDLTAWCEESAEASGSPSSARVPQKRD
jgi:cholesterol transport system auxiliary component